MAESVRLENGPDKLSVTFEQLVEHLTIIYMVATARARVRQRSRQELLLSYMLEVNRFIERLQGRSVQVLCQVTETLLQIPIALKEVLLRSARPVIRRRDQEWVVLL